jgi:serine protease Do
VKSIIALAAFLVAVPAALPPAVAQPALPNFAELMKKQGPAVVNIITRSGPSPESGAGAGAPGGPGAPGMPEEFEEFFRRFMPDMPPPGSRQRQGIGSGFILSADGFVMTNAHVVAEAGDVTVRMADGKREYKAKVVGADERTDIALLKIDAKDLPTVKLGDSSKLEPGHWVAAIGSPFGFTNTITAGIISAIGRSLPTESYVPFIQTDVAVNPGNSGGPLMNLAGEVIGVNSMIYSGTGSYMGVSFAIPIELALDISKQLQATGKVTRGRLGVAIQPVTPELARAFGLKESQGALVSTVEAGSPADKAGLKTGDVIVSFNGKPVDDANDLPRLVASTKPGATAGMEVLREGKPQEVKVTVGEMPSQSRTAAAAPPQGDQAPQLGITVSELPEAQRKQLGVDYGVVVQQVKKPDVALRPGDVILAVNRERFSSIEEFRKLLSKQRGETAALLVRRGEGSIYVPVEVG